MKTVFSRLCFLAWLIPASLFAQEAPRPTSPVALARPRLVMFSTGHRQYVAKSYCVFKTVFSGMANPRLFQEAPRPTITSLYPDAVHAGWEGVLKIKGTNFDNRSFALIDGKAPQTTYKSETLLEVELKTSLYPDAVHAGWEGVLKIKGTNFDNRSFALIDGKAPQTTYKSETLLEVELKSDITGTPGNKGVKVHSGAGGLSSEKILVVLKGSTAAKSHSVPIARTGGAIPTGRDPAGFHFLP